MQTPTVAVVSTTWSQIETDWLFLPVAEDESNAVIEAIDVATGGEIARAMAAGEFRGKAYEIFITPVVSPDWQARRVAVVGLGKRDDFGGEQLGRAARVAALTAKERNARRLAFVCRDPRPRAIVSDGAMSSLAQSVADALVFATFDAARYKTVEHEPWVPLQFTVCLGQPGQPVPDEVAAAVRRGVVLSECANAARDLSNEPGNRLRPRELAERAATLAAQSGVSVEVLDERRIESLGMGLLLGVARGSEEPPRLLVLRHEPSGAPAAPVLGLVGKGVTFDTGGISIKPSQGMERMKDDMAGGAAVVAALCAAARLQAPMRVVGVVPIAENMPSGHAIRPGDVLQSASGKTVEVLDTDAEGRLILGDALWYARTQGATHLVDIATLTGACMVALGHVASGLMGRPQPFIDAVHDVAASAGDRLWQLPLFDDYREQLKSDIADLKNVGGRPGGAITAAMFLSEFAGEGPWAHLDIAGTAWNEDAKPYLPKGPTGAGVRTLAALAFSRLDSSEGK